MQFRTPIEFKSARGFEISHDSGIVMLGSCFTDNVGTRLEQEGFYVAHNPMGALYNPHSILNALSRAIAEHEYTPDQLVKDSYGSWHCLDFATKYSGHDPEQLCTALNEDISALAESLWKADTLIITYGTAYVYQWAETGTIVGNCHKFPASCFTRRRISVEEVQESTNRILQKVPWISQVIFTVSPIRHTADGLHANQLSKSTLLLGIDSAVENCSRAEYFPAYEAMIDDLRDYRFYAADMKHPSEVGIDYIYSIFSDAYFSPSTVAKAKECKKQWLRAQHRTINPKI